MGKARDVCLGLIALGRWLPATTVAAGAMAQAPP